MRTGRPHRLPGLSYVGFDRYLVTSCTSFRRPHFRDPRVVAVCRDELLRCSRQFEMSIPAYCFMPDHLHLVLVAESATADLVAFAKTYKQKTGFVFSRTYGGPLWQPGYHERVLRSDEATEAVVRYVLENPVRAGLSITVEEYPYVGSLAYDLRELLVNWRT